MDSIGLENKGLMGCLIYYGVIILDFENFLELSVIDEGGEKF